MSWQKHRLIVMGIVALGLVGLAWYQWDKRTGDTPPPADDADAVTLPDVSRDDVTELEIHLPGDEEGDVEPLTVRLVKGDEGWRLAEPLEATASTTAVNTALDKLTDLEVTGRAARNAQFHERLEVAESNGIHVIARGGGETLIDVWIGAYQSGNTMVRPEGQDVVLMVRGSIKFAFNKRTRDWRERTITELTADEVREVEFENEHGHWTFHKGEDAWTQAEGDEPIEGFDGARVRTMVSSIARLRAADFAAPDVTEEAAGLGEGAARVRLVSGEGDDATTTVLHVGAEADEGKRYVRVEGRETIYLVSRFMADRLLPDAEAFQHQDDPPPPPSGGAAGGAAHGAPGGGQIPPEIMRQIQQQLQQGGNPHD